jgi:O-antigen/teichoic acid export membrane protein
MTNTRRIAKNTLMLYFRQILIILVSLYTVRAVLETLGAEDYGIYNLVAGVVTMFGFLSDSMAAASQRYFAFDLGRGDYEQLQKTFSLSFIIYILIATTVLLLAETIGLWFVHNTLRIPQDRMGAARWIYQCSIISFVFTILVSPFMAAIIAHEDMNIYATVSIVEVVLKLVVVFLLKIIVLDKLQLYGILLCAVTIINTGIYRTICKYKYRSCTFQFYWNKNLFKELSRFTGWNLLGALAGIFKNQGVNILLNQFFNPLVITSRGIASTVNTAVVSFSQNFSTALRPQIIKHYARGHKDELMLWVFRGSKAIYFLMYLFILPLILEMSTVLSLWIKHVPEQAVVFTRVILIDALIDSITSTIITSVQAIGKIRLYQSVIGGILLLNVPLSWIVLSMGAPPYSVMLVSICLTLIVFMLRLFIMRILMDFSIIQFLREALLPICKVSVVSMIVPILFYVNLKPNLFRFFWVVGSSVLSIGWSVYFLGLNSIERYKIITIIRDKLQNNLK